MIGEYVFEDGKIVGKVLTEPGWQPAFVTYNRDGRVETLMMPTWLLMIEEYGTGKIIYRDAEGLSSRLVSESERLLIESEQREAREQ